MNLLPAHIKGQNLVVSAPVNLACQLLLTMAGTKGGKKGRSRAAGRDEAAAPRRESGWMKASRSPWGRDLTGAGLKNRHSTTWRFLNNSLWRKKDITDSSSLSHSCNQFVISREQLRQRFTWMAAAWAHTHTHWKRMERRWWRSHLPPPKEKQFRANDVPFHESCQQFFLNLLNILKSVFWALKKKDWGRGRAEQEKEVRRHVQARKKDVQRQRRQQQQRQCGCWLARKREIKGPPVK